jgi:hypothetical protein
VPQGHAVTIAMPFEGHVAPAGVASFASLLFRAAWSGYLGAVTFSEGGVIDGARNHIVSQALSTAPGTTHLMWVDPSLVVPEDAIERLLEDARQVVGGACPPRARGRAGTAYDLEPLRWLRRPAAGLRRVGGVGLGCTLVEADVYRRLEARHQDRAWHKCFYGRGEDVFFFERCRELEVEVWLDPEIRCERAVLAAAERCSTIAGPAVRPSGGPGGEPAPPGGGARVALAMPLFEPVAPVAVMSLATLVRRAAERGILGGLFFTSGLFYDVARNALVSDVLASPAGFTHVFWMDSDMVVPADAIERLLVADRPVVGGLYHTKRANLHPAVFELDPLRIYEGPFDGTFRVDGYGLGCALVRREVYEEMAARFADERWHVLSHGAGEDMHFFRRCKVMGVEAWLDGSLRCGHVRDETVTTAHWLAVRPGRGEAAPPPA